MDSKKLALLCRELADNRKAENIVVLDVRKISSVTDYFVIATGTSEPHLRAIMDEISDTLHTEHDITPTGKDGTINTAWVVMDYFDVMVHVMRAEARERYDLEGLWNDAPRVKPPVVVKAIKPAVAAVATEAAVAKVTKAKVKTPKVKAPKVTKARAKKKSAPES